MRTYDLVIIGGGAAGLAAASAANDSTLKILVIEREMQLGGILNQCIHNGFGLHVFKEMLTGPEFADRFVQKINEQGIEYLLDTTVLDVEPIDGYLIKASNPQDGMLEIKTKALILSTGCYERTRGAISIPGDRPQGIMTAGTAQKYLNIDGYLVGKKVFILGSGDIGLIMARRMTLEGATVYGVAELMPYSNGLNRNIAQCLNDFDIPLYLSHTITQIKGKEKLESITIQKVDDHSQPIPGTEKTFEVDTLLLSVGLIPDVKVFDHLSLNINPVTKSIAVDQNYQSELEGLFACGNALHVHDLVDDVVMEATRAGTAAKNYLLNPIKHENNYSIITYDHDIRYMVPTHLSQELLLDDSLTLLFRTGRKFEKAIFKVMQEDNEIKSVKANFVVPAEMNKITVDLKSIDLSKPLHIAVSEVL